MRDSVTVRMTAAPDDVWALISDVTRIGELSPETFEAEWLGGADGPAMGARFRGHVKRNGRGPVYWTVCEITRCEPGRDFGFAVYAAGRVVNNWRYRIEPVDGGSSVTESFELDRSPIVRLYWAVAGRLRGRTNVEGMRETLSRVTAIVETEH